MPRGSASTTRRGPRWSTRTRLCAVRARRRPTTRSRSAAWPSSRARTRSTRATRARSSSRGRGSWSAPATPEPLHLLAPALRGRRDRGGTGRPGAPRAVHGRPRPRGLARADARRGRGRDVQRRGPGRAEALGDVLAACRAAGGGSAEPRWVAEARLARAVAEVEEEARPLWFPEPQIPFAAVDASRALAAGLAFRPTLETARETLAGREPSHARAACARGCPRRWSGRC